MYLINSTILILVSTRGRDAPWRPPSRTRPRPRPVGISRPRQRFTPVRRATRRSTYIKQMPLDTRSRDCDIKARCRRDPAGPRIANDSNSQNVNSRLFPVKSVSQSVIDHHDYYVNSLYNNNNNNNNNMILY